MTPELIALRDDLIDIYKYREEPIVQALWDKYPILYGKLLPKEHSNLSKLFMTTKKAKARVYTYNKLSEYRGWIGEQGISLNIIIDRIIKSLTDVKEALDE